MSLATKTIFYFCENVGLALPHFCVPVNHLIALQWTTQIAEAMKVSTTMDDAVHRLIYDYASDEEKWQRLHHVCPSMVDQLNEMRLNDMDPDKIKFNIQLRPLEKCYYLAE